jgi:hypothetical protein
MTAPLPGPKKPASEQRPAPRARRCPDASTRSGAVLYAVIGGLIVWLLVSVLPHVHIAISWH